MLSSSPCSSSVQAGSSSCWTVSAAMSADMPASSVTAMATRQRLDNFGAEIELRLVQDLDGDFSRQQRRHLGGVLRRQLVDDLDVVCNLSMGQPRGRHGRIEVPLLEMVWVSVDSPVGLPIAAGSGELESALRPPLSARYVAGCFDCRLAWLEGFRLRGPIEIGRRFGVEGESSRRCALSKTKIVRTSFRHSTIGIEVHVRDFEIRIDVLHVVVLVPAPRSACSSFSPVLVVDRDGVLRLPDQRRLARLAELRFQRLRHLARAHPCAA